MLSHKITYHIAYNFKYIPNVISFSKRSTYPASALDCDDLDCPRNSVKSNLAIAIAINKTWLYQFVLRQQEKGS